MYFEVTGVFSFYISLMTINQDKENYHGKTLFCQKYTQDFQRYIFNVLNALQLGVAFLYSLNF